MINSEIYRTCSRCGVGKPQKEYDVFKTKPERKKVCNECLGTMAKRRARIKKGLPVDNKYTRKYGPRRKRNPQSDAPKRKARTPAPPVELYHIPWPTSKV